MALVVVVAGCESRNGLYCGDGICTDPEHPFCDIDGAIAGAANTCIAVSCTHGDFKMCRGNDALICSADGNDYDDKACQNGCDPTHGCVGCTDDTQCANPTPTCDGTSHECRACKADTDCASGVCDADTGACIAESTVAYASPSGSDSASCTKADPCSFVHALAITNGAVNAVKLAAGVYTGGVTIADKAVDVYGAGATVSTGSGSSVVVHDRAHVRIHELSIANASAQAPAIDCRTFNGVDTPELVLDNVSIDTSGPALSAVPCALTMNEGRVHSSSTDQRLVFAGNGGVVQIDRSLLRGGGGLQSSGSTIALTNSVVADQGGIDGAFVIGILSSSLGVIRASFTTVINSTIQCVQTGTAECNSSSGVCLDNSIVLNELPGAPADTITGARCTLRYSVIFPQSTSPAGTNNKVGMNPVLRDATHGDYHLQPTSPAIDAADPTSTVTNDLDGAARPQGARADMGALEYKP